MQNIGMSSHIRGTMIAEDSSARSRAIPVFCRQADCRGNSTSGSKSVVEKHLGSYSFEGKMVKGQIISNGLTRHLTGSPKCLKQYQKDGLVLECSKGDTRRGWKFDFLSSTRSTFAHSIKDMEGEKNDHDEEAGDDDAFSFDPSGIEDNNEDKRECHSSSYPTVSREARKHGLTMTEPKRVSQQFMALKKARIAGPILVNHNALDSQVIYSALKEQLSAGMIDGIMNNKTTEEEILELDAGDDSLEEEDADEDSLEEGDADEDEDGRDSDGGEEVDPTAAAMTNEDAGVGLETINEQCRRARQVSRLPPSGQLKTEIDLMNLMVRHKMPLCAFGSIMNWAMESSKQHKYNFSEATVRARKTIFKEIATNLQVDPNPFHPKAISWLPDDTPHVIFVRGFLDALYSMLTNEELMNETNISFPDKDTPLSPHLNPAQDDDSTAISELFHGKWWKDTWLQQCNPQNREILIPIILYMDGIVVDQYGRLSLTPLNFTLGIFNTEARTKPEAWETLYFHPDSDFVKTLQSCKAAPMENLQNLHRALTAALESFQNVCNQGGLKWDYLKYAGQIWQGLKLKFAIAFVVGDTDEHDKLCGKYATRTGNVKMLCRHCDCPTNEIVNPDYQVNTHLFMPSDLDPAKEATEKGYFKSISHYPMSNAFHDLNFGCNPHNIHLATPGECLHMHQLGCAKRAMQAFQYLISGKVSDEFGPASERKKGGPDALDKIAFLAQQYGGMLSRQSDRKFPRTKFGTSILSTTKKEANHFQGMLLGLMLAIISDRGREILFVERRMEDVRIYDQVQIIELIISLEEWLKCGRLTYHQLKLLPDAMKDFIDKVNLCCQRDGMGTKLIKNHLYFHLHTYINYWGPPKGWNSAPNESHHKTEVKAPSRNTQRRAASLIKQTAQRYSENRILQTANRAYKLGRAQIRSSILPPKTAQDMAVSGSRYQLFVEGGDQEPKMAWIDRRHRDRPILPLAVLCFCCDEILPIVDGDRIEGFTEHKRKVNGNNGPTEIYRAHPCYRSDTSGVSSVWYDWAIFRIKDEEIPCHILCFLDIIALKDDHDGMMHLVNGQPIASTGPYAVVRRFQDPQGPVRLWTDGEEYSSLVQHGNLEEGFLLMSCDFIVGPVAVVPNIPMENDNSSDVVSPSQGYLAVSNREDWLDFFINEYLLSFDQEEEEED